MITSHGSEVHISLPGVWQIGAVSREEKRMMRPSSHASARDRLVHVSVEPIEDQRFRKRPALPAVQVAYAAYQEALQRHFRGLATMAEVGRARLAWCAAESLEVERRVRVRRPVEDQR